MVFEVGESMGEPGFFVDVQLLNSPVEVFLGI